MVIIWMLILLLCSVVPAPAAVVLSENDWRTLKRQARSNGPTFPTAPVTNDLFLLTNDSAVGACDPTGGIGEVTLCRWTGSVWTAVVGTSAPVTVTLDAAFDGGKAIDGANNLASAVRIGDGVTPLCLFTDATLGPRIKSCTDSNTKTYIENGFTWCLYDIEGDACMLTVDPDAASKLLMYQYGANYRPLKSVFLSAYSLQGDGTNCPARPTVVTISNMIYPTFVCTENNSSRLKFVIPMRSNWDGGAVYFKPYYSQTAADTGSVLLDAAAACRALGTAFNGTYGTEVNIDDATLVGSGAVEGTLSAAITPNGTCTASDWLYGYLDVDATTNPTTAAATLHFIGVEIFWSETSLSH